MATLVIKHPEGLRYWVAQHFAEIRLTSTIVIAKGHSRAAGKRCLFCGNLAVWSMNDGDTEGWLCGDHVASLTEEHCGDPDFQVTI